MIAIEPYYKHYFLKIYKRILPLIAISYGYLNDIFLNFVGSNRNMHRLTLDGIDVMGERLAQEVSSSIMRLDYILTISSTLLYVFLLQNDDKI
jgi:hypothetical protein